jgi:biopolymer transport protein TolQ
MERLSLSLLAIAPAPLVEAGGFSLVSFFAQLGTMGKVVLTILVLFSVGSWAIMLNKIFHLRKAEAQSKDFLRIFHRSNRFSEVNATTERLRVSPLVGIFQAGYAEIDPQIKAAGGTGRAEGASYRIQSVKALERSLQRAIRVELASLTRGAQFLATTAAATPFIGLFGTVWGIMIAFSDIGAPGSTSITTVAPGIAEALINTAAGLAAAIPALIGYNYFSQRLRGSKAQMEDFSLEFLNLAERNFT